MTRIDHIYTNSPYNVTSQNIITLDISDHLGTYVNLVLDNKIERAKFNKISHENEYSDYYKINAANLQKYTEYISTENWNTVHNAADAQTKYDEFISTYTKHYNSAFLTKSTGMRRKISGKFQKLGFCPGSKMRATGKIICLKFSLKNRLLKIKCVTQKCVNL